MTPANDLQERAKPNFPASSHDIGLNTNNFQVNNDDTPNESLSQTAFFPVLSLPLELRLKIYAYILPPRHHKIVTSLSPTNFFYNTSYLPGQTSYPFGHSAPLSSSGAPLSIPYKILTTNTHASFPYSTITASLLRTCRQIHAEAEPLLYGTRDTVWDFGVHLEAVRGFWEERSQVARECVRGLRVAWEVPAWSAFENGSGGEMLGRKAVVWMRFVDFLKREMKGLRQLDLMLWCADGQASGFPEAEEMSQEDAGQPAQFFELDEREQLGMSEREANFEMEKKWRQWKWTEDLLSMPSLRQTKITCWSAAPPKMEEVVDFGVTVPRFDSWVAGRMVADSILREKMVKDGVVVSEEVVVIGSTADWLRSQNAGIGGA